MVIVIGIDGVYDNEGEKVLDRCKRCQTFVRLSLEYCDKCSILTVCAYCNSKIEEKIFVCPFTGRGFHREHWKIWKAEGMLELSH